MTHRIAIVAGTRPEIIKLAPIIRALTRYTDAESLFILSGQHYDFEMVHAFLRDLNLPPPIENLEVGSGSQAQQTAQILVGCENLIRKYKPDFVVAEGDTNTVAATSLAAVKLHVPFGHVEAGLRSYDRRMPEEINRMIARVCAELHFAPTPRAAINLLYEGVPPNKVFITGNTIVDACLDHLEIAKERSKILEDLHLDRGKPIITVTMHRPGNVDDEKHLSIIVESLIELKEFQIVFPVHPRTLKMLEASGLERLKTVSHIILTKPLGYLDFLKLLSASSLVMTDSGGVQEEALTLRIPCLTLRHSTERPETVESGYNRLVELRKESIVRHTRELIGYNTLRGNSTDAPNPLGDGHAGGRIAAILVDACRKGVALDSPDYYEAGSATFKVIKASADIAGKTIGDLTEKNPRVLITLVHNQEGRPLFPFSDLTVEDGWLIRIFGQEPDLKSYRG